MSGVDSYDGFREQHFRNELLAGSGMAEPWDGRVFRNAPPLSIDEMTFRRDPFHQPLTRRRRRRLRGGKTQSARPTFVPWYPAGPMKISRGRAAFNVA